MKVTLWVKVQGSWKESKEMDLDEAQLVQMEAELAHGMANEPCQISFDMEDGWVCFPSRSIDYIKIVTYGK